MYQTGTITPEFSGKQTRWFAASAALSAPAPSPLLSITQGTPIQTKDGTSRVQDLRLGDQVFCEDGSTTTLRNVKSVQFSRVELLLNRSLAPIRFDDDTLWTGDEIQPVLISPDMPVHVDPGSDVTIHASQLSNGGTVRSVVPDEGVTYFALTFDRAATLKINGLRLRFGSKASAASIAQTTLTHRQEEKRVFRPMR